MNDNNETTEVFSGTSSVKRIIGVFSGKGGVGKSTTVAVIAFNLAQRGFSVGVLDADLCGPSLSKMIGLKGNIHSCDQGWVPLTQSVGAGRISAVSLSYLVENQDQAVIWRGPKKTAMIKQFLEDVCWGSLDYLIIDTPPGTSDEHMAVMECVPNCSVILTTSPQALAAADVLRQVSFCKTTGANILGIIETLSGFVCPNCSDCSLLFNQGGGQRLAEHCKLKFLGSVPIDPNLSIYLDSGTLLENKDTCVSYQSYSEIVDKVLDTLEANSSIRNAG
ncbi:cytosolic Fe-S cluster assembly factor NUBP2 homolog [Bolinopsis microptera]|uniref:cytosolic Fe-S cluster assembly factor NUBP2 homolog n=1 Tax=Bolinopsis microptera TaxID=2820187 RepID=UPI0030795DC8